MSSILKALKKIEEDSPPPQTFTALPNPIQSKQAHYSKAARRRRGRRLIYLLLILLVMATVAIVLINPQRPIIASLRSFIAPENRQTGASVTTEKNGIFRGKIPTTPVKPAQQPPQSARQPKRKPATAVSGTGENKFQASSRPDNRRLPAAQPMPQPSSGKRSPQAAPDTGVRKPQSKASPTPDSPPVNMTAAKSDPGSKAQPPPAKSQNQTRPRETYDRVDDSKLKLQALAWSDDSARRMAVINGRIVHEGESVDGYLIVDIRSDDIIVSTGGKSYLLEFGLQQ